MGQPTAGTQGRLVIGMGPTWAELHTPLPCWNLNPTAAVSLLHGTQLQQQKLHSSLSSAWTLPLRLLVLSCCTLAEVRTGQGDPLVRGSEPTLAHEVHGNRRRLHRALVLPEKLL